MRPFKLINIVGIDGAGKTTLAKSLAAELSKDDLKVEYRYCQYFAKLLYPVKLAAKWSVMRKTDEFADYDHYNSTKKRISSRYPLIAKAYASIWLVDYLIQVLFKVTIPIARGRKLIIDRYIFDIAINLSLTTNNDIAYAEKIISFFLRLLTKPDLIIFIDLPEEVALRRKDDIQDIEYLRERRQRYLILAKKYGFIILDGQQTQEELSMAAKRLVQ